VQHDEDGKEETGGLLQQIIELTSFNNIESNIELTKLLCPSQPDISTFEGEQIFPFFLFINSVWEHIFPAKLLFR